MGNGNPWDELDEPTNRAPRSLETREKSERRRVWQEPSVLPTPEPQDGYVFKWCRIDNRIQNDKMTITKRMQEGWEPVQIGDHPEIVAELGGLIPSHGTLERGGLILCKMPEEMVQQRRDHYAGEARQREEDAESHYMRDQSQLIKKFADNTRKVMFGQRAR